MQVILSTSLGDFRHHNWISASFMPILLLLLCQRQHALPNKVLKTSMKKKGISLHWEGWRASKTVLESQLSDEMREERGSGQAQTSQLKPLAQNLHGRALSCSHRALQQTPSTHLLCSPHLTWRAAGAATAFSISLKGGAHQLSSWAC